MYVALRHKVSLLDVKIRLITSQYLAEVILDRVGSILKLRRIVKNMSHDSRARYNLKDKS